MVPLSRRVCQCWCILHWCRTPPKRHRQATPVPCSVCCNQCILLQWEGAKISMMDRVKRNNVFSGLRRYSYPRFNTLTIMYNNADLIYCIYPITIYAALSWHAMSLSSGGCVFKPTENNEFEFWAFEVVKSAAISLFPQRKYMPEVISLILIQLIISDFAATKHHCHFTS